MNTCPERSVGRWLSILHRMTMKHVADGLKEHGVGSGQAMFLLELIHCDGVRQEELSRLLNVDGATTTRAITRLTQEGLVERRPDPEDGRAHRIHLTPKAAGLQAHLLQVVSSCDDQLLSGLNDEEQELFLKLLVKMGQATAPSGRCAGCKLSANCP